MGLNGKTAFVTGGAAGIGLAIAARLVAGGARVALADLDEERARAATAQIDSSGALAHAVRLDVADGAAAEAAVRDIARAMGGVDIVVNNAGIGVQKPLLDTTVDDFERVFRVNLFGLFAVLRASAATMRDAGRGGRIVNIASVAGLRGSVYRAAYGPSKAAVINLTQVAAVELAPHGITVNAVAPGPIETEMARAMHPGDVRAAWTAAVPQGRYGTPEDVAEAVCYLCSDGARFITGHVLAIDGGFAAAGLLPAAAYRGTTPG